MSARSKNPMKIHQLFTKKVEVELLLRLLKCFGLKDLNDKRLFCKNDIVQNNTVGKMNEMKSVLESYYLPCKAKIYLEEVTDKRVITILKQVLRLHGYYLVSKEKNVNNKKIIFYHLVNEKDRQTTNLMKKYDVTNVIDFD